MREAKKKLEEILRRAFDLWSVSMSNSEKELIDLFKTNEVDIEALMVETIENNLHCRSDSYIVDFEDATQLLASEIIVLSMDSCTRRTNALGRMNKEQCHAFSKALADMVMNTFNSKIMCDVHIAEIVAKSFDAVAACNNTALIIIINKMKEHGVDANKGILLRLENDMELDVIEYAMDNKECSIVLLHNLIERILTTIIIPPGNKQLKDKDYVIGVSEMMFDKVVKSFSEAITPLLTKESDT